MLIKDRLIANGGWIHQKGVTCFNQYKPPNNIAGDPFKAGRWLQHARKLYNDDADHIIKYFAFKVRNPHIKINHAVLIGGPPGIGKDTLIEPLKHAVGHWNFNEVSPQQVCGRFNGHIKSVILRNEIRDLGEGSRYDFYEHIKTLTASPPDVLRCDEKSQRTIPHRMEEVGYAAAALRCVGGHTAERVARLVYFLLCGMLSTID